MELVHYWIYSCRVQYIPLNYLISLRSKKCIYLSQKCRTWTVQAQTDVFQCSSRLSRGRYTSACAECSYKHRALQKTHPHAAVVPELLAPPEPTALKGCDLIILLCGCHLQHVLTITCQSNPFTLPIYVCLPVITAYCVWRYIHILQHNFFFPLQSKNTSRQI